MLFITVLLEDFSMCTCPLKILPHMHKAAILFEFSKTIDHITIRQEQNLVRDAKPVTLNQVLYHFA